MVRLGIPPQALEDTTPEMLTAILAICTKQDRAREKEAARRGR